MGCVMFINNEKEGHGSFSGAPKQAVKQCTLTLSQLKGGAVKHWSIFSDLATQPDSDQEKSLWWRRRW